MGYSVIDIIDKAMDIVIRRKDEYEKIKKENNNNPAINVMTSVLLKESDKNIEYYKKLKQSIKDIELEDIDFVIYDKMSFLINQFNKKTYIHNIRSVKDYLNFSIELERDAYSLIVDIQGRFVKNTSDVNTKTYKILSDIIKSKYKHITELEKVLKRKQ
ncbi:hypothetical protein [Clostridium felsineum]|uniref:Uncharacterized protein n=1 Tax=Clostridium felsineum TaxID=36839 RepID=A0A1S8LCB8_9CLOT|nr:hypothetical protein [Clostridium felsineum]MCR3761718.1 hypothetical protein [Clostridium felsineum]URZ02446.1 hypothetical protein CLAUR_024520 [Clostridium felsineum]URZ04815.1 hypothetical protein CLROS_001300 [Clostridium felsineum]URZ09856.1 hypothetical protein CROST_005550 [Clostridium felsineum]URZ18236.1 hypothetical protein CLFE_043000 [Clostridium felsineum DSM 794]